MINSVTLTCNKHNRVTDFTVEPMTDDQPREARKLKPCICGANPSHLGVTGAAGHRLKWAVCMCGSCCEWSLEFRADYKTGDELYALAVEAWNNAPRATDD